MNERNSGAFGIPEFMPPDGGGTFRVKTEKLIKSLTFWNPAVNMLCIKEKKGMEGAKDTCFPTEKGCHRLEASQVQAGYLISHRSCAAECSVGCDVFRTLRENGESVSLTEIRVVPRKFRP